MSGIENHFRTAAFGGFYKQDVLSYITETDKKQQKQLADLTRQTQALSKERDELQQQYQQAQADYLKGQEEQARLEAELQEQAGQLEQVRQALAEQEKQYAQASVRLEELEALLPQLREDSAAFASLKDRTATIELEAHRQAQETLSQAEGEAQALLSQADTQAQQTVEQARTQAECQAAELLTQAQMQAREEVEQAKNQAARVRNELAEWLRKVQNSYQGMRADMAQVLTCLRQELERSQQVLEQVEPTLQPHDEAMAALLEAQRDTVCLEPLPLSGEEDPYV